MVLVIFASLSWPRASSLRRLASDACMAVAVDDVVVVSISLYCCLMRRKPAEALRCNAALGTHCFLTVFRANSSS